MKFISSIYEKLHRKNQLNLLKNHPKVKIQGLPKLGVQNHFVLYSDIERLKMGSGCNFRNYIHLLVGPGANLHIGQNVFMNNFCSVNCLHEISIGENTLFGENVKLYDHNHSYQTEPTFQVSHSEFTKSAIKIGKNCWLGSNVVVLKGVEIGDNCIIGAGCIIHKNVPENTTVVNAQQLQYKTR